MHSALLKIRYDDDVVFYHKRTDISRWTVRTVCRNTGCLLGLNLLVALEETSGDH